MKKLISSALAVTILVTPLVGSACFADEINEPNAYYVQNEKHSEKFKLKNLKLAEGTIALTKNNTKPTIVGNITNNTTDTNNTNRVSDLKNAIANSAKELAFYTIVTIIDVFMIIKCQILKNNYKIEAGTAVEAVGAAVGAVGTVLGLELGTKVIAGAAAIGAAAIGAAAVTVAAGTAAAIGAAAAGTAGAEVAALRAATAVGAVTIVKAVVEAAKILS